MPWMMDKILKRQPKTTIQCGVVVPAAGSASRMEGIDKLMALVGGVPIVVRTLQALERCDYVNEIVVVTREELIVPVADLCATYQLTKVTKVIAGGKERINSVALGVAEMSQETNLIAIHDGARPFVSQTLLTEVIERAAKTGAAAPAIPLVDTIKRGRDGIVVETVDRDELWAIQTPQVFDAGLITGALQKAIEDGAMVTDDCSAVERLGMGVALTRGDRKNIKITTPFDLSLGKVIARQVEET